MIDVNYLILIASYLKNNQIYKKHGYWYIYEDDKIKIMYDTYYPNVDVYLKINGEEKLVLLRSGHGIVQQYHPGAWEKYCENVLLPKAIEAKKVAEAEREAREKKEKESRFAPIDDSKIFN